MLKKDAHYVFNFCTRWNFTLAKMAVGCTSCMARICYVTTQRYRLYLLLSPQGFRYTACIKEGNQWIPAVLLSRVPAPDCEKLFVSPETLESGMKDAFFRQFPDAEVSFFEDLPSCDEVRATLSKNPYDTELVKNFYIFTRFSEIPVEDADGVIDVLCYEGTLSIPYDDFHVGEEKGFKLQMYRSLLHPDNKLLYLNKLLWDRFDILLGKIRSISWSNFRHIVDKKIQ